MFISDKGLELIKKFEGCILQSYDDYNDHVVGLNGDVLGTLTIGFGHIEGVYKGQTITADQADNLLREDMATYCNHIQNLIINGVISFPVTQNMFDALVSFDYNLGSGSSKTLCENRDKATVADKMLLYVNKGSVWEEGLTRRRTEERSLFLSDSEEIAIPFSEPQQVSNKYEENGIANVRVHKLNIRTGPSVNSEIVGSYGDGEEFSYNYVIDNEGYRWVRYIGSSSGQYRFVAVRVLNTNEKYANCR